MILCVLLYGEDDLPSSCVRVHPAQPVPIIARVGLEESMVDDGFVEVTDLFEILKDLEDDGGDLLSVAGYDFLRVEASNVLLNGDAAFDFRIVVCDLMC
jgi:hypothetical protein